jgi:hypothetical protein
MNLKNDENQFKMYREPINNTFLNESLNDDTWLGNQSSYYEILSNNNNNNNSKSVIYNELNDSDDTNIEMGRWQMNEILQSIELKSCNSGIICNDVMSSCLEGEPKVEVNENQRRMLVSYIDSVEVFAIKLYILINKTPFYLIYIYLIN